MRSLGAIPRSLALPAAAAALVVALTGAACRPGAIADAPPAPLLLDPTVVVHAGSAASLPPLDLPATIDPEEVDRRNREGRGKLLVPSDRVVGVVLDGEARAYPLRLLRWHEVVNDIVAGRPIAVAFGPLADMVVVLDRRVAGAPLSFAASGWLASSTPLLADRQAEPSLWSPLQARAVAGPAAVAGSRLAVLPSTVSTWSAWRSRFPDTTVMAPEPRFARRYRRDPYHSYFGSDLLRFPVAPLPPPGSGLSLKDRVLALAREGDRLVVALPRLAAAAGAVSGRTTVRLGALEIDLEYSIDPPVLGLAAPDQAPPDLDVRFACHFAWHAAHPDSPVAE